MKSWTFQTVQLVNLILTDTVKSWLGGELKLLKFYKTILYTKHWSAVLSQKTKQKTTLKMRQHCTCPEQIHLGRLKFVVFLNQYQTPPYSATRGLIYFYLKWITNKTRGSLSIVVTARGYLLSNVCDFILMTLI
jgi:hypothetical protein